MVLDEQEGYYLEDMILCPTCARVTQKELKIINDNEKLLEFVKTVTQDTNDLGFCKVYSPLAEKAKELLKELKGEKR